MGGVVRRGRFLSFQLLCPGNGGIRTVRDYLKGLPETASLLESALKGFDEELLEPFPLIRDCEVLPPVPDAPALLDFGLTPRHLCNSAAVLFRYQFGKIPGALIYKLVKRRLKSTGKGLPYYKCNHSALIGHGATVEWPSFTSYLDIEPELAFVTGNREVPIGGYLIFNDSSARDIQFAEMFGTGPAKCKDFRNSKGLGPFLVTPEEIENPLNFKVKVQVGERGIWTGSTLDYSRHPDEVAEYLFGFFDPLPGTVVGMGTVPFCTGLDRDEWLRPGDKIDIHFEGLGTLTQYISSLPENREKSPWPSRKDWDGE